MRIVPDWASRDRFIMSKGHAAAVVYAVLAEMGFIEESLLETYCQDGSILTGHVSHHVPGVDFSTGSLGHGLSVACGMAMAGRASDPPFRAFVILSDGELDEGSIWEPALLAPHLGLDNLVALIDYNKIQSFGSVEEVLDLSPLADKWRAFGWGVREIDGNDADAVDGAMADLPFVPGKPSVIVGHTVKGKGVPFMEDDLLWHYRPPNDEQLAEAIAGLEAARVTEDASEEGSGEGEA